MGSQRWAPPSSDVIILPALAHRCGRVLLQAYLKASEAMAEARRELVQGLVGAASDAFSHPDLLPKDGGSPEGEGDVAKEVGDVGEILSQLGVAEGMQLRQVQSLVLEPLQRLLDDPRGLGCVNRMYSKFGSTSSDFYEAFQACVPPLPCPPSLLPLDSNAIEFNSIPCIQDVVPGGRPNMKIKIS